MLALTLRLYCVCVWVCVCVSVSVCVCVCVVYAQLHSAHDMFAADEEMRAAGVRHSDAWMAMKAVKAARTQSLLSKHVRVSSSPAPTAVPEEIAAEKRRARELESEWMVRRISAARAAEGKQDKAEKSKVDAAMALLHAAQDAKVHQAIDIVHAADHAVRFASTIGGGLGKKPATTTSAGGEATAAMKEGKVGGSAAGVAASRAAHNPHTLEADVQALQHEVLAKIAEERAEADGKTFEQLAVAPQQHAPSSSSAFEIATEKEQQVCAAPVAGFLVCPGFCCSFSPCGVPLMCFYLNWQQLAQQGKVDHAIDLIANPTHVMYEGNRA